VPGLAERRGDLLDWIERLWGLWFRERGRPAPPLALKPAAAAAIVNHGWPDNLRGVDRLVHELALRGPAAAAIELGDLPRWLIGGPRPGTSGEHPLPPAHGTPAPAMGSGERPPVPTREEFLEVWQQVGGSVRAMARHFGRDRRQIYRWLAQHGVRADVTDDD
jgi:transcriptional regulator of acetoin/glycerol metabolism